MPAKVKSPGSALLAISVRLDLLTDGHDFEALARVRHLPTAILARQLLLRELDQARAAGEVPDRA